MQSVVLAGLSHQRDLFRSYRRAGGGSWEPCLIWSLAWPPHVLLSSSGTFMLQKILFILRGGKKTTTFSYLNADAANTEQSYQPRGLHTSLHAGPIACALRSEKKQISLRNDGIVPGDFS